MSENPAKGITWDLSDLYSSIRDPKIFSDLKLAEAKAVEFEKKYRPLFERPGPDGSLPLDRLLADYKEIVTLMTRPGIFAHLAFAEKTHVPEAGAFMQKIHVTLTGIESHLLFFQVHWNRLDESAASRLMAGPAVSGDRHFLEKLRCFAPHTLNEGEEKIMAVKANTSDRAFGRLFDEVMNNIPFYVDENGQRVKKTEGEVLSLFHSAKRGERKTASDALAGGLQAHARLLTYIFNMILADHRASMKIRRYKHPMDAMNLSNEIDLGSVLNLVENVKKAYPIAARYYHLKEKLLGLDKLYDYDRYAPVEADETRIDFNRCKEMVLGAYHAFAPEAGRIVEPFFTKRWIDAEIREGKQGGGFSCQTTPDLHPYILVNYTGSLRDVMTVAHELGHGLHQWLSRDAGILESHAPLTMAETASVFGEMLVFEKIMDEVREPGKRLALLCGKIDDHFATVFRQIAMTDFELAAHEAGLSEGELLEGKLNGLWLEANARLYGDSVELTENYRHGWKYIPHFIHTPFYCYAYAFAQLFVFSLYQKYKQDRKSFVPKFFKMLSLGGSKPPAEIAAMAGIDIQDPSFWQSGIGLLEELVIQAEKNA